MRNVISAPRRRTRFGGVCVDLGLGGGRGHCDPDVARPGDRQRVQQHQEQFLVHTLRSDSIHGRALPLLGRALLA